MTIQSFLQPHGSTWTSSAEWRERIITFDPSWFTVCMGTGVIVQLLTNFPYPTTWLRDLGYCFWILDIVLFTFFIIMSLFRLSLYTKIALTAFDDFAQTSYLGAIPIAWETVATGIIIFYSKNKAAVYVAEVFYWVAVAMATFVSCGGVYAMYKRQGKHEMSEVNGAWFLTFIPLIVAAALGSNLVPHLSPKNGATVLIVSYIMVSLGLGLCCLMLGIYLWRLMSCQLPARDAIISCFVPVGPLGMSAFAIVNLAVDLSEYIIKNDFTFNMSGEGQISPSSKAAIAEMIIWFGVLTGLLLLGVGTFFLIEAFAAVFTRLPKTFNIGFWSFVFPCGVYANAFCRLSTLLRNDGMKGWAAACVTCTILLWLICAIFTTWKGIIKGRLFFAPGLQGWMEQKQMDELRKSPEKLTKQTSTCYQHPDSNEVIQRHSTNDGSYNKHQQRDGSV